VPCSCPTIGSDGNARQGGLVRRSQVVQVEEIGLSGAGPGERLRPGRHEPLIGGIVDRGKDTVGARRPVLVGGLEGNQGGERVGDP
jgi:hypothetical protein